MARLSDSPWPWLGGFALVMGGLAAWARGTNEATETQAVTTGVAPPSDFTDGLYTPTATQSELTNATSYTVVRGDSLSAIALAEWGDEKLWLLLWGANRSNVPDPNLIQPGQVLTVPDIEQFSVDEQSLARHYYKDWRTYSKL